MMKRLLVLAAAVLTMALAAAEPPSPEAFVKMIRKDHPRLFLTKEQIPAFRERARTVCKEDFEKLKEAVDKLPDDPKFEFKTDVCKVEGKKITFFRLLNDQNECSYAVKTTGGFEAARCAVVYMITGDKKYRDKALKYIKMSVDFCEYSRETKMLYAWYHYSRICTFLAYDWIADTLTYEEKAALIKPLMDYTEFMRKPGFTRNSGGVRSGNYGEDSLLYFCGIALLHEGIDDKLAERQLVDGYKLFVDMMNYRDEISGGSGVLVSICSGYSFGAYPTTTFLFLHTLRSAAGIDGTDYWTQPKDYTNWFLWAMIQGKDGLLYDYGWGDAFHYNNRLNSGGMYTNFAQIIHFFNKKDPVKADLARAAITVLPEKERVLKYWNQPYLPFILTGFDPAQKPARPIKEILNADLAQYMRNAGLVIARTGVGPDETYASFKAGARFSQHQHYDENTFIIYRKGYQAADTGVRGPKPHHIIYYPQTIAHNAILIRMANEPLASYWGPAPARKIEKSKMVSDGGQSRACVGHNLGFAYNHYYAASAGDATATYSSKKCKEAVRFFVFVRPGIVIVYDRVESVKPEQEKAFALQFCEDVELLPGLVTRSTAGDGAMFTTTLLPKDAKRTLFGGPGKEFWTNGQSWPAHEWHWAKYDRNKNPLGRWRLEVTPEKQDTAVRFLHVLEPVDTDVKAPSKTELLADDKTDGVRISARDGSVITVKFARTGDPVGTIEIAKEGKTVFAGPLFKLVPAPKAAVSTGLRHFARIDMVHRSADGRLEYAEKGNSAWRENPRWMGGERSALTQFHADGEWKTGTFSLKVKGDGQVSINLRGPDVRDANGKFLPRWVEFSEATVNGRSLLPAGKTVTVWHSAGYGKTVPVKDGELLKITLRYRTVENGPKAKTK